MTENRWLRSGFVWIILIIAVVALWITFISGGDNDNDIGLQQVANEINLGIVDRDEMPGVHQTLDAAALTYVAAFVAALGSLLHILLILAIVSVLINVIQGRRPV